jgi:hypothetical protein
VAGFPDFPDFPSLVVDSLTDSAAAARLAAVPNTKDSETLRSRRKSHSMKMATEKKGKKLIKIEEKCF